MSDKIKLDIVSDVVCPWCTIGYKRLERAIVEMGIEDRVEIEWQPFELNPNMPSEGQNIGEHLSAKYGASADDQKRSQEHMAEQGAELGFTFDYFDDMRIVNTRNAHILLEYAKAQGKQTDLKMQLTRAFFSERKDVSQLEVLKQALIDVGLDAEEGLELLDNEEKRKEVVAKEQFWHSRGVSSVPTFVFNDTSGISGAQPVAVFKQVLTDLLNE